MFKISTALLEEMVLYRTISKREICNTYSYPEEGGRVHKSQMP